jgi:hypothetical protein
VALRNNINWFASIISGAALFLGACKHEPAELAEARSVYWLAPDGGLATHAGNLNSAEVDHLRAELQKLTFPVKQGVVQHLIPSSVKPKAILHWDGGYAADPKAPLGGMVEDYWLNASTVLRVASAYYHPGEFFETRSEWAEIIDATRAYIAKVDPWRDRR